LNTSCRTSKRKGMPAPKPCACASQRPFARKPSVRRRDAMRRPCRQSPRRDARPGGRWSCRVPNHRAFCATVVLVDRRPGAALRLLGGNAAFLVTRLDMLGLANLLVGIFGFVAARHASPPQGFADKHLFFRLVPYGAEARAKGSQSGALRVSPWSSPEKDEKWKTSNSAHANRASPRDAPGWKFRVGRAKGSLAPKVPRNTPGIARLSRKARIWR